MSRLNFEDQLTVTGTRENRMGRSKGLGIVMGCNVAGRWVFCFVLALPLEFFLLPLESVFTRPVK